TLAKSNIISSLFFSRLTLKLSISNPPLVSCVTMGMALLLVWLVSSTSFSVL
ncbi:unnamed protein product, partial [Brassica oleracea]